MTPISKLNLRRLELLLAHPTVLSTPVRTIVANWLMTGMADLEENRQVRRQHGAWTLDPVQRYLFFVAHSSYRKHTGLAWRNVCETHNLIDDTNL